MRTITCDICEREIKTSGVVGYNEYPAILDSIRLEIGDVSLYLKLATGSFEHPDICRECWDRELAGENLCIKFYDHRNKHNQSTEYFKREAGVKR